MKNKKKGVLIAVVVIALIVVAVAAVCINKKAGDSGKLKEGQTEATVKKSDTKVITFAVPDICRIDENNIKQFNAALMNDGYDYELNIKYLEYDEYSQKLESTLAAGKTDVAFLGLGDENGNNPAYDLISSNLVLNLDDVLSKDHGKTLYDAFPKNLWEMAKCDGHIYSIPSAFADDNGVYAAFNKDYLSDDVINSWDGSIDGIYQILKASEWDNSKAPGFQYLINGYVFGDMIGCEIRNGLCFDYDTMSVENPLESQKFTEYLKVLDQMKKDGYLKDDETGEITYLNNIGLNNEEILQNVKSGNFIVALSSGEIDENFQKDNIAVKTVEHYLTSRVNASIGIAKNTEDVDTVVEFLGLLYGDGKYADILLYGQNGADYKVVDGVACNTDGTDLEDDYLSKLCLDLFINVYPVTGERYMENRKDAFFALYDNAGVSPFIGFEPDTENLNNISNDLSDFMNGLNGKSVEESIEGAKERLTADGMDSYLESVRSQWEEYKQ